MKLVWLFRMLPWAVFVPSALLVPNVGPGWAFVLGIANGAFACFCGLVVDRAKELARWYK